MRLRSSALATLPGPQLSKVLDNFYLWLQQIYPNEKTNNWANLLFSVFKTEENALKQFFELFGDFCLENSKKDSNSLTLIELIELVRTSPEKYIEKYDVECFHAFLIGYMLRDKTKISDEKILTDFYHWLQKRYIIYDSRGWSSILLLEAKTGEKALDMFFELFDIFLGRTTEVVPPPLTNIIPAAPPPITAIFILLPAFVLFYFKAPWSCRPGVFPPG